MHTIQVVRCKARGAVGDICLRFYARDGKLVDSHFNQRVVGISADQIRAIEGIINVRLVG